MKRKFGELSSRKEVTRFLPVRHIPDIAKNDFMYKRLSMSYTDKLSLIKKNLLYPKAEDFYISAYKWDVIFCSNDELGFFELTRFEADMPYDRPTMLFMLIQDVDQAYNFTDESHALLAIYFPHDNSFDILTTYAIEPEKYSNFVAEFQKVKKGSSVHDVSCEIRPATRKHNCYDLQSSDTQDIGWCVAWMVHFALIFAKKSKDEFWGLPWSERKHIYKQIYDLTRINEYDSMKTGIEIWNHIINELNEAAISSMRNSKKGKKSRKRTRKNKRSQRGY